MDTTKSKITGLRMILCNYYSYKVNIVGEQLKTLDKPTCIALIARFRKDKQTYVEALACFVKLCEIDMKITINTDNLAGFKKEVDFYRFIIPFLTDYQRSLVMAYDDQYYLSFPECVGATISILSDREIPDETGALVLLDLKDMGYTSPNAHLDLKSCKLVLSQMAKMHAAPIAVKLVSLEKFKAQVVPHLINARYRKKPYGHLDARTLTADVLKMNDLSDLISYINSVIEYSKSATELDIIEDDTWFTLCHSNFNIRNLMIKYDPTGNPHSCKIIDLKYYSYSHCCDDLLFFLFTSVDIDVLIECYPSILDYYYTELILNLNKYPIGKKAVPYTKEHFLEEVDVQGQKVLTQIIQAQAYTTCEGYRENGEPILGPLFTKRLINTIFTVLNIT